MTVLAVSPSLALSRLGPREAMAWGGAAVIVLAAHLMIAYGALYLRELEPAGSDTPPALTIELAPMAVATAIQQEASLAEEVPPETAEPVEEVERLAAAAPDKAAEAPPEPAEQPTVERAEPVDETSPVESNTPETIEPERTAAAEPVEAEPVEAENVEPEPVEPELVEARQEPLEQVVPDIVEAVKPDVLVPLPEPRPVEKKAAAKKIVEKAAPQKAAAKKAAPEKAVPEKAAPKKQEARQKPKAAASAQADAKPAPRGAEGTSKPRISPAKWQARVQSWLNRHKRYPSGAKARRLEGNVQVSFTIDPSGRVTSSRIARSSGNAELDRAALDMVRRASPVPAPPPEIARSSMRIAVPVSFNLK